nr:MAG TPA: hypothetical protein [Caudoviricetes sp.]
MTGIGRLLENVFYFISCSGVRFEHMTALLCVED